MASRSDSKRYISVDVECVATGYRHDDHSVCFVAVVDSDEKVLLKMKVKPDKPVVSYLTPLTGFRAGDLDDGESLDKAIDEVKKLLGPDVILVGQNLKSDIKWLRLEAGKDYSSTVELAEMFKTYNPSYGNRRPIYFPLSHEANTLLSAGFIMDRHDPATDAIASMKLFNKYHGQPALVEQAKKKLLSIRVQPSFAKRSNYRWEGVCMAAFMPQRCTCGAPTMRND